MTNSFDVILITTNITAGCAFEGYETLSIVYRSKNTVSAKRNQYSYIYVRILVLCFFAKFCVCVTVLFVIKQKR